VLGGVQVTLLLRARGTRRKPTLLLGYPGQSIADTTSIFIPRWCTNRHGPLL
jgi:hypothetical protein